MQVSRSRYWWCPRCRAAFEKEDLAEHVRRYDGKDAALPGTRTCRHCGAAFLLRDIYAGRHDAPREAHPRRSSRLAWILLALGLLGAVMAVGYVMARPFLAVSSP